MTPWRLFFVDSKDYATIKNGISNLLKWKITLRQLKNIIFLAWQSVFRCYCWYLAHYFWLWFFTQESFQAKWKLKGKLKQTEQKEVKKRGKKIQILFLKYSFLQGSSMNIFLTLKKYSFVEAIFLAYMQASTKN